MYTIKLYDGTEFNANFCSARNGVLTLSVLSDLSFEQIAQTFCDTSKTSEITFVYGPMRDVYTDYTGLCLINGATPGEYIMALRRAEE